MLTSAHVVAKNRWQLCVGGTCWESTRCAFLVAVPCLEHLFRLTSGRGAGESVDLDLVQGGDGAAQPRAGIQASSARHALLQVCVQTVSIPCEKRLTSLSNTFLPNFCVVFGFACVNRTSPVRMQRAPGAAVRTAGGPVGRGEHAVGALTRGSGAETPAVRRTVSHLNLRSLETQSQFHFPWFVCCTLDLSPSRLRRPRCRCLAERHVMRRQNNARDWRGTRIAPAPPGNRSRRPCNTRE